ncbi:hypothetical protein HYR54_14670 [Candidatus Acetothermia bacterium]|nr:hypothetical protein [Candidatus Acetothermia bacterium]MBI3459972.1 hypothetical protein [Candidatus Acetothermia bacterium]
MKLQVFTLAGRKLVEQTEKTGSLEFEGTTPNGDLLANGLYLYTLTVKGADGKLIRSELRKLAVRR